MFAKEYSLIRKFVFILMLLGLFSICPPVLAEQQEPNEQGDFFEMPLEALMEVPIVVTTGASRPLKKEQMPATVTVITADELKLLGLRHLTDVINYIVPGGVGDIHRSQRTGLYCFRGIAADNNGKYIFMIDGLNCTSLTSWGAFNERYLGLLDELDRIEITQGVGSTLYGSGATSGVINFITKTGRDFQGTELTSGYGRYDRFESSIKFGERKADDWNSFYYFGYKQSDGFTPKGGGWNPGTTSDLRRRNRDNHADAGRHWDHFYPSFKFHGNIQRGDLTVRMRYVQDKFEEPYTSGSRPGQSRYMMNTADCYWFHNWFFVQPEIKHKFSENSSIKASLAFGMDEMGQEKARDWWSNNLNGDGTRSFIAEAGTRIATRGERKLRGQFFHYYDGWANHKLTSGLELFWMHSGPDFRGGNRSVSRRSTGAGAGKVYYRSDSRSIRPENLYFAAFLAEDIWQIDERTTFFAGVRVENHNKTPTSITPRFAISHDLSEKTNLKFLYNTGYRTPPWSHYSAVIGTTKEKPDPEKVQSFELHILHKFSPKFSTSLIGYYTMYKDLINFWSRNQGGPGSQYNWPEVKATGLEFSGDYRTKNLKLKLSHSFSRPVHFADVESSFDATYLSYNHHDWAQMPTHMTKAQAIINLIEDKCTLGLTYFRPWGIRGQRNADSKLKWPANYLNATLTLKLNKNFEFQVSGYNLTGEDHPWWGGYTYDGVSRDINPHTEYFIRLIWKF